MVRTLESLAAQPVPHLSIDRARRAAAARERTLGAIRRMTATAKARREVEATLSTWES